MSKHQEPIPPPTERKTTRLIFPVLLVLVVYFASGSTVEVEIPEFPLKDKLIHFLIFGLMATLIIRVSYNPMRPWRSGAIAVLATSLYGSLDEFRQSFTPGRMVEVLDWVADTAGALVATIVYIHLVPWRGFLERPLKLEKNVAKKNEG